MDNLRILIIGGGIGGLTSAIALSGKGHRVTVIERDPDWSVYGVGIIQQGNVIRAMTELGVIDDYLAAGVGFDYVAVHAPDGTMVAKVPSRRLVERYPANLGIGRRALHKILGDRALAAGAEIHLGVTVEHMEDNGTEVASVFSNGSDGRYDIVLGSDGLYSQTRALLFADAPKPGYTGQAVWRYNLPRPEGMDALHVYNGRIGAGLVPISEDLMYIYLTTPEPDNPRYPTEGLAAAMREKLQSHAPAIRELAQHIVDDEGVVYRPLETHLMRGPWHVGRIALLGDAVHAATPHLGQGAGMAIEDSLVLADELTRQATPEAAFTAYRERRFERCRYIVETSLSICHGQIGKGPPVDNAVATAEMFERTAQPI